jgi:hypothetical protein
MSVTLDDVRPLIAEEVGRQLAEMLQERALVAEFVKSLEIGIKREIEGFSRGSA